MADEEHEGETLQALLDDLDKLSAYLHERGQNAYTLAQRFLENARREQDQKTKTFDEQQARMLDYQRYIWHEIAGLVEKLTSKYQEGGGAPPSDGQRRAWSEEEQRGKQETAG
jgi:hypothetical protein